MTSTEEAQEGRRHRLADELFHLHTHLAGNLIGQEGYSSRIGKGTTLPMAWALHAA